MADNDELARISVRVGPAHPELFDDLAPLPQSARAERLRSLATAALLMLGHGAASTSDADVSDLVQPSASSDPDDRKKSERFESLRESFDDAL